MLLRSSVWSFAMAFVHGTMFITNLQLNTSQMKPDFQDVSLIAVSEIKDICLFNTTFFPFYFLQCVSVLYRSNSAFKLFFPVGL